MNLIDRFRQFTKQLVHSLIFLLIAFQDDYFNKLKRLSLFNEPKNLPVRKNYSGKTFKSWKGLSKYLLPFFDSHKDIITGTKIYFNSFVSTDNFNSAKAALENLTSIVKSMKEKYPKTNVFEVSNNRLLNHKY